MHVGRQHNRRIPIFAKQAALAGLSAFGVLLPGFLPQPRQTVMLQNKVFREIGENCAVDASGLLDDGKERHGQHNAFQFMPGRMFQGEAQHRKRLARAGRCGQGECACRLLCRKATGLPERLACGKHVRVSLCACAYLFGHVTVQGGECGECVQWWPARAMLFAIGVAVEVCFSVEKISIHQT